MIKDIQDKFIAGIKIVRRNLRHLLKSGIGMIVLSSLVLEFLDKGVN